MGGDLGDVGGDKRDICGARRGRGGKGSKTGQKLLNSWSQLHIRFLSSQRRGWDGSSIRP